MEEGQRLVLLDQVKDWCGDSRTKVTIKPVIDLNADLADPGVRGPRPDPRADHPPRPHLRVPVVHPPRPTLRHRPRRRVRPRRRSRGPTTTRPHRRPPTSPRLCRFHHRLKTHTAWRYRMTEPGVFEWTSPHGHRYRRDRTAPPRSTRPSHPTRPTSRDPTPTMTPPHTPPRHRLTGPRQARLGHMRRDRTCPQDHAVPLRPRYGGRGSCGRGPMVSRRSLAVPPHFDDLLATRCPTRDSGRSTPPVTHRASGQSTAARRGYRGFGAIAQVSGPLDRRARLAPT